jgi:hypothetical protein
MMMYPPPRQDGPTELTHPEPPESVSAVGTKRKRKSTAQSGRELAAERGSDEDAAAGSTSDVPRAAISQQIMQSSVDLKKRTKTVNIAAIVPPAFLLTNHV